MPTKEQKIFDALIGLTFAVVGWSPPPRHPVHCDAADGEDGVVVAGDGVVAAGVGGADGRCY
jgi:hypothetical protein